MQSLAQTFSQKIKNFYDALKFFSKLEFFGIKLGLEQTMLLANFAGNPHEKLKFIHVAGTNGKGTVCALLASACTNAGLKTALYTSPHLISPRERFKINGTAISENDFAKFSEITRNIVNKAIKTGAQPTYFEVTTIMALLYFLQNKCDIVVWECGLGGRLDSTNIVKPEVSIITSIGLDHQQQLGNTCAKIAREKAGIIKENTPCFCGKFIPKSARSAIAKIAKLKNSDLIFADKKPSIISQGNFTGRKFTGQTLKYDGKTVSVNFPGKQQTANIALCCEVLKYLSKKLNFSYEKALEGFVNASLPARMTILPDGNIVDGAHNPQAIKGLVQNIKHYFLSEKFSIVFACLHDKDANKMIDELLRISQKFIFVPLHASRKAYSPAELEQILQNSHPQYLDVCKSTLKQALKKEGRKIICGSFYLAGEALREYFTDEQIINWRKS